MHHNYFIQNNYYKFLFLLLGNLIFFCNDGISGIISFREEEITVTYDDIQISGTLSIPSGEGPFPTLIIISGSGPQNRDWDFDHNGEYLMGRIMANDLAQHGIAMFRYDDRGTGKSTGEGEDIRQLTEDVLHIMQHLKKNPSIGKIGLCGHSLGAEVALHAAVDNAQVNFLILLSSPFITGKISCCRKHKKCRRCTVLQKIRRKKRQAGMVLNSCNILPVIIKMNKTA